MPRPKIPRRISFEPNAIYFKPRGIPLFQLSEEELTYDEVEALRLHDASGINQIKCAKLMEISQPTFARILESARMKVAKAIVHGKAIKISKLSK